MKIGFRSLNHKFPLGVELVASLEAEVSFARENGLKPIALNMDFDQTVTEQLPFSSLVCNPHALNLAANHRPTFISEFRKSLRVATTAGSRYVSLHGGFRDFRAVVPEGVGNNQMQRDRRKENLLSAAMEAEADGVELLIENNGDPAKNQLGTSADDLASLLAGFEDVGVLLNVGRANLNGGAAAFLDKLGGRIKVLDLSDNHGTSDERLVVGEGNIDWRSLFSKLRGNEILLLDGWLKGKSASESILEGKRRVEELLSSTA